MNLSNCTLNEVQDIVFFSHGITGHRANWLRIFAAEAESQQRIIHFVMEASSSGEKILDSIREDFKVSLCVHISQTGSKGVAQEVLGMRAKYPHLLISTTEGEEWFKLIWNLKRRVRVLYMRPYIQEISFVGARNYLFKFLMIGLITRFKSSKVGLLSIPGDRPILFRSNWVDELSSNRGIPDGGNLLMYEELIAEVDLPRDVELVLVPGFITKRKNPELIIEAFRIFQEKYRRDGCALLFSGQVDENYKDFFHKNQSKSIVCIDRYLTENEYSCLLHKSKLVILAYNNRASSGVIVDCMELSRRVIFTGDRRWRNLYDHSRFFLIQGSKKPSTLAAQILMGLGNSENLREKVEWREDREDVLQFFFA